MSSFKFSFKRLAAALIAGVLALTGCSSGTVAGDNITLCDFSGFTTTASEQSQQMLELYQYIVLKSSVKEASAGDVKKMADNVEAFYVKVVEEKLEEYNSRGNDATFEEMLKFLYQMESREALRFFAESYAKAEVKNRMVIYKLAEQEGVEITDAEYEALKSDVVVNSYLPGDSGEEIRYELLRRKVLAVILERIH